MLTHQRDFETRSSQPFSSFLLNECEKTFVVPSSDPCLIACLTEKKGDQETFQSRDNSSVRVIGGLRLRGEKKTFDKSISYWLICL